VIIIIELDIIIRAIINLLIVILVVYVILKRDKL